MCMHAQRCFYLVVLANVCASLYLQVVNRAARGGRAASAPPPAVHMDSHAAELPANAVVADLGEGLEVLHLFTGRAVCALTLPAPGLHADVNGDGVLDHVYVRPRTHPCFGAAVIVGEWQTVSVHALVCVCCAS